MTDPRPLVLATKNPGKITELKMLLQDLPVQPISLDQYPDVEPLTETGTTFRDNALEKAVQVATGTGELSLADDSGLMVDALDGRPGVYSARFAGPDATDADNLRKLLDALRDVPYQERTARFKCVIALVHPQLEPLFVEGTCEGYILDQPVGDQGFGYDPVFFSPEFGKSFAELTKVEKNQVSHRGRALQKLPMELAKLLHVLDS